jgi:hypothetical protein
MASIKVPEKLKRKWKKPRALRARGFLLGVFQKRRQTGQA